METAHIDLATLREKLLAAGLSDDVIEAAIVTASVSVNYSSELRLKEGLEKCLSRSALLLFILENSWSTSQHLTRAIEEAAFTPNEVITGLLTWATANRWRSYAGWIYTHLPVIRALLSVGTDDEILAEISGHCDEPLFTVIDAVFGVRGEGLDSTSKRCGAVYTALMYRRGVLPKDKATEP